MNAKKIIWKKLIEEMASYEDDYGDEPVSLLDILDTLAIMGVPGASEHYFAELKEYETVK